MCFSLLKVARRLLLFPLDMDAHWLQVPDDVEKFGSEAAKWAYLKMLGRWEKLASGLHESQRGVI